MDPKPPPTYYETFGMRALPQEAPPNYNDLFPGVRSVKETVNRARENGERVKLPLKLYDLICKSFFCGCCYVLFAPLPITMIVIGSVYLNDCTVGDHIPIFLIIFGYVIVLQIILGLCKVFFCRNDETNNKDHRKNCDRGIICQGVLFVSLLFCVIFGNVFTFQAWPYWVNNGRMPCPNEFCCEPVVMYFTFSVLIIMQGGVFLCTFGIVCFTCLLGIK